MAKKALFLATELDTDWHRLLRHGRKMEDGRQRTENGGRKTEEMLLTG